MELLSALTFSAVGSGIAGVTVTLRHGAIADTVLVSGAHGVRTEVRTPSRRAQQAIGTGHTIPATHCTRTHTQ